MRYLAKAILKAAAIREGSWDGKKYGISLRDACANSVKGVATQDAAYIMLAGAWNDAIKWAELNSPTEGC